MLKAGLPTVRFPDALRHTNTTVICRLKHICRVYFEVWTPISRSIPQRKGLFRRKFDVRCFDLHTFVIDYELVS